MIDSLLLHDLTNPRAPNPPTLASIKRDVAAKHGLTVEEMIGHSRIDKLAHARQEVMWLAKKSTRLSSQIIAKGLGLKDPTTVLHGAKAHQRRLDANQS